MIRGCAPLLLCALCACPNDPQLFVDDTVAIVGSIRIDEAQLLRTFAQRGVPRVQDPTERRQVAEQLLDTVIDEALLQQVAESSSTRVTEEAIDRELQRRAKQYLPGDFFRALTTEQRTLPALRESVRNRLLQDAVLATVLRELPPISDEAIAARYQRDNKRFQHPAQVHVRQVLLRTGEEARHVLEQLQRRKLSFEEAAQQFSIGPERDVGGDLGFFAPGEMPPVFEICHTLPIGTISPVITSEYGFHLFEVMEKRATRIERVDEVSDLLSDELAREQNSAQVEQAMSRWRQQWPPHRSSDALDRVLARMPVVAREPSVKIEPSSNRSLDSHSDIDPVPPVPRAAPASPPPVTANKPEPTPAAVEATP
jgi:peptidyl-prolyl cis-trans isomerase C